MAPPRAWLLGREAGRPTPVQRAAKEARARVASIVTESSNLPTAARQAFKLTQRQLLALALGAAEHAFLEAEEKVELQERMRAALPRALLLRMQQEEALAQAAGSQGTEPPLLETARAELASGGKVAEAAPRMLPPAWRRMWVAPSSRRHSL